MFETVQCNFTGPFAYDIVTHVRKVKHDLLDAIMKKDSVNIKTEDVAQPEAQPEPLSIVRSKGAATKNTLKKTTALGARPQQVIRNVDGALAPAVLSYLQHNGLFRSASAMRKDMNSRKRLLDTGVEDPSDARQQKMAKTEEWYETQEDSWRQLQSVKLDYTENRLSKVWNTLRDSMKSSVAYPHFLDSFDGLWACRIRTRYFLKIVFEILNQADRGSETVDQITLNLPELTKDPEFRLFLLGDSDKSLRLGNDHELDASSILLAIGHNLRAVHGSSTNPLVGQSIDSALSYMPYVSAADLPEEMFKHISKTALTEEAEELIKAIRGKTLIIDFNSIKR
ncbi:hypothetical protein QFC19_004489 [Naganishia cerealis]|uniref:Uncharacterized protein n=1 Tax=Naganishia cerealis TaxID=610337 RepID=A0ACC2VVB6_9TREE|nr:hypothetical protein QFC19_004489 [Naganishia cerealis]